MWTINKLCFSRNSKMIRTKNDFISLTNDSGQCGLNIDMANSLTLISWQQLLMDMLPFVTFLTFYLEQFFVK